MNCADFETDEVYWNCKSEVFTVMRTRLSHLFKSMSKVTGCQGSLMCVNKAWLITSVWLLVNNRFPQLNSKTPAQTNTSRKSTQVCQTFLIMDVTVKQGCTTTWLNRLHYFRHSLQWMQAISKSSQSHAQLMWWIAHCSPVFLLSSCGENIAFTFHSTLNLRPDLHIPIGILNRWIISVISPNRMHYCSWQK